MNPEATLYPTGATAPGRNVPPGRRRCPEALRAAAAMGQAGPDARAATVKELRWSYHSTGVRAGRIAGPEDAARLALQLIGGSAQEEVLVLCLDQGGCVQAVERVARGTVTECPLCLRDAFRTAVAVNAARIILAHNHPTGHVVPSANDRAMTERAVTAGRLLGITVCDHLIVGPDGYFSFRTETPLMREDPGPAFAGVVER